MAMTSTPATFASFNSLVWPGFSSVLTLMAKQLMTNLVARFFQTDGTDLYYLSHPASHHCLATESPSCDYATESRRPAPAP